MPVRASDVCLLFRRFIAYQDDVTRSYVEALESRGVPHLLVGGKTFHEREEVDALRTALSAIEWPEDELSVFATLRGPLFALGDEELLEYHARPKRGSEATRFIRITCPRMCPQHLAPWRGARDAARAARRPKLSACGRHHRPTDQATRAHAGFMLWRGGEQVLANVLHIAELARQYESEGGLSFRGFVETLRSAADRAQAPEAPILEEGSEGVRLMTVHKAKGLEFPVVILADITCSLSRDDGAAPPRRGPRGLCAIRLAGWAPLDLIENNEREARRDEAEGVRLAYVAATRARDLLVVPAIGDAAVRGGLGQPAERCALSARVEPTIATRRCRRAAVQEQGHGARAAGWRSAEQCTVRPGEYELSDATTGERYSVVWWDPTLLDRPGDDTRGLRRDDLIAKDARPEDVAADRDRYAAWQRARAETIERGAQPAD